MYSNRIFIHQHEVHLLKKLIIRGPCKFNDEIFIQGSKNSVLPIIASSIVSRKECIIKNCPDILDVHTSIEILNHIGCKTKFEDSTLYINSENISNNEIPDQLMRKMRSSIIFLGALIARTGRAKLSLPGGCELGPRPIDIHLSSLQQLGISIKTSHGEIDCKIVDKIIGTDISLPFPSVGATENIILSSLICEGKTTINNASREPEIVDLANFLNKMGAKIYNAGTSKITIEGVKTFQSCEHKIISDRIVAITYMCIASSTGSTMTLKNINSEHLSVPISLFEEMGCCIQKKKKSLKIISPERLFSIREIRTMPYPGFPTDALPLFMSCLSVANGTSILIENIFKNRFRHVQELCRFGAKIKTEGNVAVIEGIPYLSGADVQATDLRGAASLLISAIASYGTSTISNLDYLLRGYDISYLLSEKKFELIES